MNVIERVETDFHKQYYSNETNSRTYYCQFKKYVHSNNIDLIVLIGAKQNKKGEL